MSTSTGFCHCCGKSVLLLTDVELDESICTVCRSYDVVRVTVRNRPLGIQLYDLANIFFEAFDVEVRQ